MNESVQNSRKINRFVYVSRTITLVFLIVIIIPIVLLILLSVYRLGYKQGYYLGQTLIINELTQAGIISDDSDQNPSYESESPEKVDWGGPDLWEAVNDRREDLGVNRLEQADDLCTVASIRLNELLQKGELDAHLGFTNFEKNRPELSYIFQNYSGGVTEFLQAGAQNTQEAIELWENTLAHRKILTAGEYVWGCIYAQDTFAVAITAF